MQVNFVEVAAPVDPPWRCDVGSLCGCFARRADRRSVKRAANVGQVSHLHLSVVHPTHVAHAALAWRHCQGVLVSAPMPTKPTDFEG